MALMASLSTLIGDWREARAIADGDATLGDSIEVSCVCDATGTSSGTPSTTLSVATPGESDTRLESLSRGGDSSLVILLRFLLRLPMETICHACWLTFQRGAFLRCGEMLCCWWLVKLKLL